MSKKVSMFDGVPYSVETGIFINRFTGEKEELVVNADPIDGVGVTFYCYPPERHIPFRISGVDTRRYTLTPEDKADALREAAEASRVAQAESLEREKKKLKEVWGEIADRSGKSLCDFFPEVFKERG